MTRSITRQAKIRIERLQGHSIFSLDYVPSKAANVDPCFRILLDTLLSMLYIM
jgi:hypothetical protein